MESNKKMVLFGGLVLVLIFGVFGTYVHFNKQDIIISSEKNTEKDSEANNSKKNNTSDVKETGREDDITSNVNNQSNDKASTENKTNGNESAVNNEKSTETSEDNLEASYISYTVLKGDTLTNIWRKNIVSYPFSIAKEMILSKNNMSSADELKPGEKIEIPFIDSKGYTKYSVKQGDNLTAIAQKFFPKKNTNEAIEVITKVNGSENVDHIEVDQVLLIPTI